MKINRYSLGFILTAVFLTNSCVQNNDVDLNLNFEKIDYKTQKAITWQYLNNEYYNVDIDSKIAFKGSNSLRIENVYNGNQSIILGSAFIAIDSIKKGQIVKLTGFIKTENTNSDSLGLCISYTSLKENVDKITRSANLLGTNDWKEYTIELVVQSEPENFAIGVCLFGKGRIWVDNLKLFINGKQISKFPPTRNFVASKNEIKWLQNNCTVIKRINAETGFNDLEPLKKMIGDARIVALGENTHGTSEVFKIKHRIIEFLSKEMGFSIFSIEANMPEAYRINEYILYGKGDPKKLLKGMYFWTWNTQEVLDMIEWMRKFNESGKGLIQFTGFDMQFYLGALENLGKFCDKNDHNLKSKLDSISLLFKKIKGVQADRNMIEIELAKNKCKQIISYLTENKEHIIRVKSNTDYKWLVQNANILLQCIQQVEVSKVDYAYRDKCMADNISWILENNPNAKIILWAHNGHISKGKGSMGSFLSEKYGDKYFNVGFLSNSGTYTAFNSNGLSSKNILKISKPGSFEYSFHKTGLSCFFLDFNLVNENEAESKWLTSNLDYREIGAIASENQFNHNKISKLFNSIIYCDSTNATQCFDVKQF